LAEQAGDDEKDADEKGGDVGERIEAHGLRARDLERVAEGEEAEAFDSPPDGGELSPGWRRWIEVKSKCATRRPPPDKRRDARRSRA
jgi:hypothetical protein